MRILSVMCNDQLSFSDHVPSVYQRLYTMQQKIGSHMTQATTQFFVQAMGYLSPRLLQYPSGRPPFKHRETLQMIQNAVAHLIFNQPNATMLKSTLHLSASNLSSSSVITALTFSSFTQSFDICSRFSPRHDVAFRVSSQNISSQTEHKALDELGLFVFLKQKNKRMLFITL